MIDIHSHIIFGVDDGAKNENEALLILKQASRAGFTDIICTPHYRQIYKSDQKTLVEKISILKGNVKNVNLYLGREVFISEDIIDLLKQGKICTLANSRYLLIELPFRGKIININVFSALLKENGIVPILAHPERYDFVKKEPIETIRQFIKNGWLIQCNYGSLIGQYGFDSMMIIRKLLKEDLVHFLASDIHHSRTIYDDIPKIQRKLKRLISDEKMEEITTLNQQKILKNEII